MSIPRFSFAARFRGQPVVPGIGNAENVVIAGLNSQAVATPESPGTWTIADSVRDNYAARFVRDGTRHAILDQESTLDTGKLLEVADAFSTYGITSWWFAPTLSDDGSAGVFRESDPARYGRWLAARRAIHMPPGLNFSFGIWPWKTGLDNGYWAATALEQMLTYKACYPDARLLPIAWHRYEDGQGLVPPHLFRAMLRLAILVHGRVAWAFFDQDAHTGWSEALAGDHYLKIFFEEAGVPIPAPPL